MSDIEVQTEIEKKLGIAVVNPAYPPGHVRRYGATDNMKAIDNAQAVNRAMTPVLTNQKPIARFDCTCQEGHMAEEPAGEYVRYDDIKHLLQVEPPADRKSALDEIVRISEEAGLYDDPPVERELMQRSLELLRAFRHAYEPGTQFPLIGELESFIEKGRRERYISAARNRLMQLGRSEDVATEGAKSLWRTASTETGALTPEKDADEYDVGYEAGRDTL